MKNQFGRKSKVHLHIGQDEGRTFLKDVLFRAPFKVMSPFQREGQGIECMILSASAGIMAGDIQEFSFVIEEGSIAKITGQSFEKIHRMEEGKAVRKTKITVGKNASLCYDPLPTIPFAGSVFESNMKVYLEDESSRFIFSEVLSCGRATSGERFRYDKYQSLVEIFQGKKYLYRDNIRYIPKEIPMNCIGMYEGYSHLANVVFCNTGINEEVCRKIQIELEEDDEIHAGMTCIGNGSGVLRLFGNGAQKLEELCNKYINQFR